MKELLKQIIREPTTWAGFALIVTGIGEIVARGDLDGGIKTIGAGCLMVIMRGRTKLRT